MPTIEFKGRKVDVERGTNVGAFSQLFSHAGELAVTSESAPYVNRTGSRLLVSDIYVDATISGANASTIRVHLYYPGNASAATFDLTLEAAATSAHLAEDELGSFVLSTDARITVEVLSVGGSPPSGVTVQVHLSPTWLPATEE